MPWRDYLLNRFGLKLFSVLLAALIWYTIRSSIGPFNLTRREYRHVPITVMTTAAETRAFRVDPSEVKVTLSGELNRLQGLKDGDIVAFVNLTDIQRTAGLVKPIEVHTPAGISVVSVDPPDVRVEPAAPMGSVTNLKSF
jgi:YbbR domain-containing protein